MCIYRDSIISFQSIPFGTEYLIALNPDFVLEIVRELLNMGPSEVSIREIAFLENIMLMKHFLPPAIVRNMR